MNKIAIVGHPASGCREVESLLHQCGMHPPRASRREGLFPQDITATLCKAHGVPAIEEVTSEEQVQQIQVGAVWNGMALDLMLGNLDQSLWGWTDPQAIFLLDYWESLDPKLTFVLVYDEPHRALIESARVEGESHSPQSVQQVLDNWAAYNASLLRFYLRHPRRCLLVHSQQVGRAVDSYLQQLQPLLGTPLARRTPTPAVSAVERQGDEASSGHADVPVDDACFPQSWAGPIAVANLELPEIERVMRTKAAERYLVDGVLTHHPVALQLYAELQSVANLPLDRASGGASNAAAAWEAFSRQRVFFKEFFSRVHGEYQRTVNELNQTRDKLDDLTQAVSQRDTQLDERADEELSLVTQLHQAQEELERLHEQSKQKVAELAAELEAEKSGRAANGPARAGTFETQAKDLREENDLLVLQLHQAQEELEQYLLGNQRAEEQASFLKPPGPSGAAKRVKRQLSYRLGAAMVQRSDTVWGWLAMPWALAIEVRAFRKERKQRAMEQLPPIHRYLDAHEAERVKQHLSYRLGAALLKHGKSPLGWIRLPFVVGREVKQFRRERRKTKG